MIETGVTAQVLVAAAFLYVWIRALHASRVRVQPLREASPFVRTSSARR